ncbi:MAG: cyclic nucleotide-binding domain-containing protein [Chloroflexi bacterium]|nr:cyclic nucleotide-binding domain-containing protein [Chloroflexota bacterium]
MTDFLSTVPPESARLLRRVFPELDAADLLELASVSAMRSYPPDHVLCHEGEIEDTFYVISAGQVEVSKSLDDQSRRVLKQMGAGEFFGEMALIHNVPRGATVKSLKPVTVLEIDKSAFDVVLRRSPVMDFLVVRELSARLSANDQLAIQDLRQKNVELAEAYRQLAEQERLRSEFLTTVSHELRTPLTSANGFMQFIRSGALQGDALNAALETVAKNIATVVRLVNDILFLQEMDLIAPAFKPVDVGAVAAAAVEELRARATENKVGLRLTIAPALPSVQGDAEGLARVFRALLDNAIKFSPDGGDVGVTVSRGGGRVVVEIADGGVGIPEEHRPHIFDRFYRVETMGGRLFGGAGLGLSVAKHVVEQHNGTIEFRSEVGKGSTFVVKLPPG